MADAQQPLLPGSGADVDGGGDACESSAAAAAVEARLEASSCRLDASLSDTAGRAVFQCEHCKQCCLSPR